MELKSAGEFFLLCIHLFLVPTTSDVQDALLYFLSFLLSDKWPRYYLKQPT